MFIILIFIFVFLHKQTGSMDNWFYIEHSSGFVMEVVETKDGGSLVINTKNGGDNQMWKWADEATLLSKMQRAKFGLDFLGLDDPIIHTASSGNPNQKWQMSKGIIEKYTSSNVALDVASTNAGADVTIKTKSGLINQKWTISKSDLHKGWYFIEHSSGLVAEMAMAKPYNNMVVSTKNSAQVRQLWQWTETHQLVNKHDAKLLAIDASSSREEVVIFKSYGKDNQKWEMRGKSIHSKKFDCVLDVGNFPNPGTRVKCLPWNGQATQQWFITCSGSCLESGLVYDSADSEQMAEITTAEHCQKRCELTMECIVWTLSTKSGCWLHHKIGAPTSRPHLVSGSKYCSACGSVPATATIQDSPLAFSASVASWSSNTSSISQVQSHIQCATLCVRESSCAFFTYQQERCILHINECGHGRENNCGFIECKIHSYEGSNICC